MLINIPTSRIKNHLTNLKGIKNFYSFANKKFRFTADANEGLIKQKSAVYSVIAVA